mgnify:FL=1|tara:strand:- start:373 stop:939 length:567 start_codon:yes stop_codon:yes gene_type:complete
MHEYNTLHPWRPEDGLPTEGILMLRHGPRGGGELPSMDEPLTDDGIEATKCVGRRWVNRMEPVVVSSPVDRCLHTSQLLVEAAGWDIEILETKILGDPGPFVVDSALLSSYDEDVLFSLKAHINGNQIPGMLDRDIGVDKMISELLHLKGSSEVLVACTHDSILAAVAASYGIQGDHWPPYLEGYLLW